MTSTIISVLIVLLVVLLFLAALLIFRAVMYGRVPPPVAAVEVPPVEGKLIAEHLAKAIRVQTVSTGEGDPTDLPAFDSLHAALEAMYPRIHGALKRERVGEASLLYTWAGRAPELEPVLLCGHMDVVPCDPQTRAEWRHAPFAGDVADGFVWGRGALDMKSTVIAVLEALEGLIRAGYQPERTIYIALGHDEEIGGHRGARCISALLEERGVRLAAVLDEGAAVMDGLLPGVSLPVALVGIAEKGYASVELKVEGRAGHSSMPPKHTAIGVLARAVARLENSPMPARMYMARLMFAELGAFLPFSMRLALANPWLFGKTVQKRFEASSQTGALVRTTMAATMMSAGVKDNILPATASVTVNCRLMPGDTRESLLAHIRKAVNDEAVQLNLPDEVSWEASPVSQVSSPVYRSLSTAIRQVFPDALVAPYLVSGATNSRHYAALSPSVYRFSPYLLNDELLKTVHGVDERMPVDGLGPMVQFYTLVIKSWTTVVGAAE